MRTVSLGTLLLEHQPDDSFVLVKPIRAPNFLVQTAVQGAIVPDQEIAVCWLQRVRADLRLPALDNDGIWSDNDGQTARINLHGTATSSATSTRYNTPGKGKATDPVNISDEEEDEQQGAPSTNKNRKRVKLQESKKKHLKRPATIADGHKRGKRRREK